MTYFSSYQPALGLQRAIALTGLFPTWGNANGFTSSTLAQIHTYAWGLQAGGVPTSGQLLSISQNNALFALLGTDYGGNGSTNFALPNLAGRISIGMGSHSGYFSYIGESTGADTFTLDYSTQTALVNGQNPGLANAEPDQATTYVINATGLFPSDYGPTYDTIGMITQFAGSHAPNNSIPCDGRLLAISQYTALYSIVGTTYGGNGVTNFAVPDLRGKTIVGVDSEHPLGLSYGADSQTLTLTNLPFNMGGSGTAVNNDQPSIAMHYLVAMDGLYPSWGSVWADEQSPYIGEVMVYAGTYMPSNFVDARGQQLSVSENLNLYSLLGFTYGGDGETTFALPNLGGRTVVGTGSSSPGLAPITLGQTVGQDSFQLSTSDFGALTIHGTDFDDRRGGGDQADKVFGHGGNDTLYGNGGDDVLVGGAGGDAHDGGGGTNTASYEDATVGVVASLDAHLTDSIGNLTPQVTMTGDAFGDTFVGIQNLLGSDYNDFLIGDGGANRLDGGAGDDVLQGGAGADLLIGGAGVNRASYEFATAGVVVDLVTPSANTGDAAGDTYQNISGIIGSRGNDTLRGDGSANVIVDMGGSDQLFGLAGDDRFGITGTPTMIDGGDGTDTLFIKGNAAYTPAAGAITGIERVFVSDDAAVDFTNLAVPFAVLRSASVVGHGVSITGTGGADVIDGLNGIDHLYGGAGNDVIAISNASGTVDGGIGVDTLRIKLDPTADATFDATNLTLIERVLVSSAHSLDFTGVVTGMQIFAATEAAAIAITGTGSADKIRGTSDNDTLNGGAGDDSIIGGAGADRITGGLGADTMRGGEGSDTFVFGSLQDMVGNARADRITDFTSGQDRIDLSAIDADGDASNGVQHFTFIGTDAFHAGSSVFEANVRTTANAGVFYVQFDTNHDGKADATFQVFAGHAPIVTDFLGF